MTTQASTSVRRGLLGRLDWGTVLVEGRALIGLLLIMAIFTALSPNFLAPESLILMTRHVAMNALLALGMLLVVLNGGIDLSVGSTVGLTGVVAGLMLRGVTIPGIGVTAYAPVWVIIIVAVAVGALVGWVNGLVITRWKVAPFIATLGTLGIAQGLAFVLSGGPPVSIQIPGLGALGNGYVVYWHSTFGLGLFGLPEGVTGPEMRNVRSFIPLQLLYAGVLTATCAYLLSSTQFGRHVYAIGGSAKAALRAGIPVKRDLFKVYVLSSVMASLAGLMYVLRYTGGVASSGDALLLSSIAAIVIGGASLFGGEGRIGGTLVGAMIIAVIQNGLVLLGIDPFWQYAAVGAVIILAVLADQAKLRIVR